MILTLVGCPSALAIAASVWSSMAGEPASHSWPGASQLGDSSGVVRVPLKDLARAVMAGPIVVHVPSRAVLRCGRPGILVPGEHGWPYALGRGRPPTLHKKHISSLTAERQ